MGLRDWAVRRKLNQQFQVWKLKLEAERLKPAGEVEASMPVWLHTVLVIFSGGALAAAADALTNGFTADKAGFTRLASAAFAGGLVALVAWLKQSPIAPSSTAAAPRDANGKLLGLLLMLGLPLAGCASMGGAQAQLGVGIKGPKGVDAAVVEGLVCRGEVEKAEGYAQDRGASRAEVTEAVERARRAVKGKPGCCAASGTCEGSR